MEIRVITSTSYSANHKDVFAFYSTMSMDLDSLATVNLKKLLNTKNSKSFFYRTTSTTQDSQK
jgi:hypothetical protein